MDHNDHLSQDKKELNMESDDFIQPLSAKHFKFSGLKIAAIVLVGLAIIAIILILNFSKLSFRLDSDTKFMFFRIRTSCGSWCCWSSRIIGRSR